MLTRITVMNTQRSYSDEFTITLKDKCRDATIVSPLVLTALDT